MQPSTEPLILKSHPDVGDLHPQSPQYRAVQVRLMDSADIEGQVIYAGPKSGQVVETFVLG